MPVVFNSGKGDSAPAYVGAVLETRERNYYDDSDFYAIVWDDEEGKLTNVEYATTRFWSDGSATVDATDEVKAKAEKWAAEAMFEPVKSYFRNEASRIVKGSRVKVVKGRKAPVGTEGVVFYMSEKKYGYHKTVVSIGISPSGKAVDGKYPDAVWTYRSNVELVDGEVESRMKSDEEIRELLSDGKSYNRWKNYRASSSGLIYLG